jgi:hypothetical protein
MQQLVEYIARSLVDHPEQVSVDITERDRSVLMELHVAPDDMGRIIGKQGHIVRAVRILLKAAATRQGKRVSLDVL